MASRTGLALSHRTMPRYGALPASPVGLPRPARPRPAPDWGAAGVISFDHGDFVISLSTSSLDHCDGAFLFQNSASAANRGRPAANSRIPRRVGRESSWIIATSKWLGRGNRVRALQYFKAVRAGF